MRYENWEIKIGECRMENKSKKTINFFFSKLKFLNKIFTLQSIKIKTNK
jgi:hypothetical protein